MGGHAISRGNPGPRSDLSGLCLNVCLDVDVLRRALLRHNRHTLDVDVAVRGGLALVALRRRRAGLGVPNSIIRTA